MAGRVGGRSNGKGVGVQALGRVRRWAVVSPTVPALVCLAAAPTVGCGVLGDHGAPMRDRVREVGHRTPERSYRVHVPPGGGVGRPVVLAFHGRLGSGRGMERLTHLDRIADRYGFTVVYPEGVRASWNDGRPTSPAARAGVDDVAFVSIVIDDVVRTERADRQRVFATGFSTGGMFTERLGCELAGRLAGIASVAGPLPVETAGRCRPARPLPVLLMQGTEDPVVPYGGGPVSKRGGGGSVMSVAATADRWRSLDGCGARPVARLLPKRVRDGTRVSVTEYPGCRRGTSVAVYTVAGGGHAWPGGSRYLPRRVAGRTSRDFDAGETIWRFFARAPRG